jgi:hypothetical protein
LTGKETCTTDISGAGISFHLFVGISVPVHLSLASAAYAPKQAHEL